MIFVQYKTHIHLTLFLRALIRCLGFSSFGPRMASGQPPGASRGSPLERYRSQRLVKENPGRSDSAQGTTPGLQLSRAAERLRPGRSRGATTAAGARVERGGFLNTLLRVPVESPSFFPSISISRNFCDDHQTYMIYHHNIRYIDSFMVCRLGV